jgi:hypothetical protein
MTIEVYAHISSAPSRLVLMTCECLGLDYKFVSVDILEGEHKLPEYTKVRLELHIVATDYNYLAISTLFSKTLA